MPACCHVDAEQFYDLICIGAGPSGLALCSRLYDSHPAALYTDVEHARLAWLRKRTSGKVKPNKGRQRELIDRSAKSHGEKRSLVLDASSNQWMSKWKTSFEQLEINTLRSPLHFHCDSSNADALRCYAMAREDQLTPISLSQKTRKTRKSLSTKERQINERDMRDYQTPSQKLFLDFCQTQLIDRYDLSSLVKRGKVVNVTYGEDLIHLSDGSGKQTGFCIELEDGRRFGARAVVFAGGGTGTPAIPKPFAAHASGLEGPGWTHSARFYEPDCSFPSTEELVVVGGGLTSAQIVDLAIRRGVKHVTLVCRSKLKVKPFDVPLEWVAKFSSVMKASFWQCDDLEERLAMIRGARAGGSVTPAFSTILHKHVASGKLTLLTEVDVESASYGGHHWSLSLQKANGNGPSRMVSGDHVILATGSKLDIDSLSCFSALRDGGLLEKELGFPAVNEDLQVVGETKATTMPLFFTGAYAALQLGPAAFNLAGAREGAERIAHRLAELNVFQTEEGHVADSREALAALDGNHFALLAGDE